MGKFEVTDLPPPYHTLTGGSVVDKDSVPQNIDPQPQPHPVVQTGEFIYLT